MGNVDTVSELLDTGVSRIDIELREEGWSKAQPRSTQGTCCYLRFIHPRPCGSLRGALALSIDTGYRARTRGRQPMVDEPWRELMVSDQNALIRKAALPTR